MTTEEVGPRLNGRRGVIGDAPIELDEWADAMAQVSASARGFVYVAAGALLAAVALGYGSPAGPAMGALAGVAAQPLGQFLLIVLALGLFACAGWYSVRAFIDPERLGRGLRGLTQRTLCLIAALIYTLAGVSAALLSEQHPPNLGLGLGTAVGRLLTQPLGSWQVGMLAVALIGYGIYWFARIRVHR